MLQEYLQIHDPSPSFYCVVNVDYEALCSDFVWKLAHSKYNRWTEKGTHAEPRETGREKKGRSGISSRKTDRAVLFAYNRTGPHLKHQWDSEWPCISYLSAFTWAMRLTVILIQLLYTESQPLLNT